jgi:AcrR family transcriptional regulator
MSGDTRDRLMDAAEELFAAHGLGHTTVRMIVGKIEANVASIRFHFGSLEGLKREVLVRRFEPLVQQRLERLAEARRDDPEPLAVGELLSIWFAPMLAMVTSKHPGERAFPVILARMLLDQAPEYRALLENEIAPHVDVFLDELARALPGLSREQITMRFDFAIGAFGHALNRLEVPASGAISRRARAHIERTVAELLRFAEAGLEAPSASV